MRRQRCARIHLLALTINYQVLRILVQKLQMRMMMLTIVPSNTTVLLLSIACLYSPPQSQHIICTHPSPASLRAFFLQTGSFTIHGQTLTDTP